MKPIEIKPDIYWIGVNDTSTRLFEGLWLIEEEGISYNSYLIKDEKTALIDLCKEVFQVEYLEDLSSLVDLKSIDYVGDLIIFSLILVVLRTKSLEN